MKKVKIVLLLIIITTIIIAIKYQFPQSKAEESTSSNVVSITYQSDGMTDAETTSTLNEDTYGIQLLDFGDENTSNWTHDDIEDKYTTDSSGSTEDATYTASFAGWKLISINGNTVTGEYIYPDNDYVYTNDDPFKDYTSIDSLTFEAVWGKTIYVRDQYNFVDITDVYGYVADLNGDETDGDILTAKIAWDTTTIYSSDYYSGASKDYPVASLEQAYNLLADSYGGKIYIVNHLTLEGQESSQSYSDGFKNKSATDSYYFGQDLNISGVVTISGENMRKWNIL